MRLAISLSLLHVIASCGCSMWFCIPQTSTLRLSCSTVLVMLCKLLSNHSHTSSYSSSSDTIISVIDCHYYKGNSDLCVIHHFHFTYDHPTPTAVILHGYILSLSPDSLPSFTWSFVTPMIHLLVSVALKYSPITILHSNSIIFGKLLLLACSLC